MSVVLVMASTKALHPGRGCKAFPVHVNCWLAPPVQEGLSSTCWAGLVAVGAGVSVRRSMRP